MGIAAWRQVFQHPRQALDMAAHLVRGRTGETEDETLHVASLLALARQGIAGESVPVGCPLGIAVAEALRKLGEDPQTAFHRPQFEKAGELRRRGIEQSLFARRILAGGTLVVRQVTEQTAAGLTFKQPKTAASRRTITLPTVTVEALIAHRSRQAEDLLKVGLRDPELVFTRMDGEPVNPRNFSKEFVRHVRAAGVTPIGFHGLRHTHLTHLMAAGEPINVVAERAGHASAKMTLDIYGHVLPGMQADVARRLDDSLRDMLGD